VTQVCFVLRTGSDRKPGGDVVQLRRTAEALSTIPGWNTAVHEGIGECCRNIVHLANVDTLVETLYLARRGRQRGAAIILAPVYHPRKWVKDFSSGSERGRALRDAAGTVLSARGAAANRASLLARRMYRSERDLMAELLGTCDGLHFLAHGERSALEQEFGLVVGPATPQLVAYNGSLSPPQDRVPLSLRSGALTLGRIEPRKNQLELAKLADELPFDIYFAGRINSRHRRYAQAFLTEIARHRNAHYLGEIEPAQVASRLNSVRMHILPSWAEVAPLVDLEALQAGCVTVSTAHSFAKEVLGPAIVSIEPGSLDATFLAARYADTATQSVVGLPTWGYVAAQLTGLYSTVLQKRSGKD
jgi:glycosyltransferase involved in cell wall biosynthesis